MNVNPTSFKKCTALYTISAFGYGAIYMQGYFTGRPMQEEGFMAWAAQWNLNAFGHAMSR